MKKLLVITFAALSFSVFTGFKVDETPLQKLLRHLAKITAAYPQEKVHLHLDKPYYAIGEDLWIKAYVVTAEKNEPSELSKVVYVDLVDQDGKISKKVKLEVKEGLANGHISLVDSLSAGQYQLRAYTNYMRNYDEGFFFTQQISIGDILEKPVVKESRKSAKNLDVQFFPEGGDLINGIRMRVGIKATTADGVGATINGYIANTKNEQIALLSTEFAGMGAFAIRAEKDEKYHAVVTLADGETQRFNLPKAKESGHMLSINQTDSLVNIRIGTTADLVPLNKELFVVGQSNGIVLASFELKAGKEMLMATIPLKKIPTGLVQFTLFEKSGQPIAERLIFVNHQDDLKMELIPTVPENYTRQKATWKLKVSDANQNPVDGNFSVAVTDLAQVAYEEEEQRGIIADLLFSADIKGYIEKPNYYFQAVNEDKKRQLDHLLLTQGWRRFLWKDILAEKEPDLKYRPEQTLEIAGKVTSNFGKPLSGAKVSLLSITPGFLLKLDTVTNAKGDFVFDRLDLPDSASFIIQAKMNRDNDVMLTLNGSPAFKFEMQKANSVDLTAYLTKTKEQFDDLEKHHMFDKGILLKTVIISKQRDLKPIVNVKNSANLSGGADKVISREMMEKEISIFSPFLKVPGVTIKSGKLYSVRRSSITGDFPMLIIVDGVKIDQNAMPDYLSTINPQDVEGIEILTSGYNLAILGSEAPGGAVYITTKTGGPNFKPTKNNVRLDRAGFNVAKQFYMPNYDDPRVNKQLKDLRSTVYWNPSVVTNAEGHAEISYFNAGAPGTYRLTIEGLDSFGNIGRKVITVEVKASMQ